MEKIVKRLFIGGALLVALAVSFTALNPSYAAEEEDGSVTGTTQFKFNVPEVLTLSNVQGVSIEPASLANLNEGNITANVSANNNYVVKLSAATPNLTLQGGDPSSASIPAVANPQGGVNGWSVKNLVSNVYQAITTEAVTFYNGAISGNTAANIAIPVGIGVAPTLPNGTYSTVVTLTVATAP